MTHKRIISLAKMIPDFYVHSGLNGITATLGSNRQSDIDRDTVYGQDPQFGWHFVDALIKSKTPLPSDVHERYLRRAYRFETGADNTASISKAMALNHPLRRHERGIIKAYLLTEASFAEIEKLLGVDKEVLAVFECLFWNVRDRMRDSLYINSLIYPHGKQIELRQNYFEQEDPYLLLMRAGYENGVYDLSVLAGIKCGNFASEETSVSASKLEAHSMAMATFLVRNGFYNQRIPAISAARAMISANKLSGQVTTGSAEAGISTIGSVIMSELKQLTPTIVETHAVARKKQALLVDAVVTKRPASLLQN